PARAGTLSKPVAKPGNEVVKSDHSIWQSSLYFFAHPQGQVRTSLAPSRNQPSSSFEVAHFSLKMCFPRLWLRVLSLATGQRRWLHWKRRYWSLIRSDVWYPPQGPGLPPALRRIRRYPDLHR